MRDNLNKGFTLVEMAIVMVILSILAGGITLGSDLIHATQLRATVKQIEMFDMAYGAFKLKYNCIPGDCKDAENLGFYAGFYVDLAALEQPRESMLAKLGVVSDAAAFNPIPLAISSIQIMIINGNGDGYINDGDGTTTSAEQLTTVPMMKQANFLQGYDAVKNRVPLVITANSKNTPTSAELPAFWFVSHYQSNDTSLIRKNGHYYWPVSGLYQNLPGGATLLAVDAYSMDLKMDDGSPAAGRIMATTTGAINTINGPSYNAAVDNGPAGEPFCRNTNNQYNVLPRTSYFTCAMVVAGLF